MAGAKGQFLDPNLTGHPPIIALRNITELGNISLGLPCQREGRGGHAVNLDATNQPKSGSYIAEYTPYTVARHSRLNY
jgi:hypothetical protein